MNKLLITLASIVFFASCSEKKPMVYENDTDFHEWANQYTIRKISNAHSGGSASVIDSADAYSLGFTKKISDISSGKISEVKISYWAFVKSEDAKATTVFSIDLNGKNIHWDGHALVVGQFNKWVQINESFRLPERAKPDNQITLYVLNTSKEEILIDDLKITFN